MWISSTEQKRWTSENAFADTKGDELIIKEEMGRPLYGFGCCFSEICVMAVRSLPEKDQREIFNELFGKDNCSFEFCRLSIGANDFAESWYSYNENEGDYEMKSFSIDRDRKYIIPAIKDAMKLSPNLRFFASPWSPPTWMKFPKVFNYGNLVETEENLKAYALYFKKYLEEYKKEGVKIEQIHVQNEFHSDQKFPSCVFTGDSLANFIGNYLAPAIGDMTDIWYGTVNGPENDGRFLTSRHNQFLGKAMEDEKCRAAIKGASYQWAGKFGVTQIHEDFPELDTLNGEMECGDGQNTWQHAIYLYEMMHHYFKYGARACVYWNMALANHGLSTWGWRQNSLISVDDGKFEYTPEFYLIKHFAKFVKKGAVMLRTEGRHSSNSTVFKNEDGSRVLVTLNPFDKEKVLTVEGKNYILAPRSLNSIVL